MHLLGFLGLAVIGIAPAFLAGWFDPRSRRRRDRARRDNTVGEPPDLNARRSRLSDPDPGVWRDKPAANAARREQQDENASI